MNVSLKRVAITLVAILSFLMASAQTEQTQTASNRVRFMEKPERVWPFEAEIFYGLGTGFKYHGVWADGATTWGLELRGNIKNTEWDVGAFLRFDGTGYDFKNKMPPINPDIADLYTTDQSNSTFTIGVVSDYNFRQEHRLNPFAGLGIGYTVYSTVGY